MAANEEEKRGGTPCGVHLRLIYHRGNGARSRARLDTKSYLGPGKFYDWPSTRLVDGHKQSANPKNLLRIEKDKKIIIIKWQPTLWVATQCVVVMTEITE